MEYFIRYRVDIVFHVAQKYVDAGCFSFNI